MKKTLLFLLIMLSYSFSCYAFNLKEDHPRLVDVKPETLKGSAVQKLLWEADYQVARSLKPFEPSKYHDLTAIRTLATAYLFTADDKYYKEVENCVDAVVQTKMPKDDQKVRTRLQSLAFYYDFCFERLDDKGKSQLIQTIEQHIHWLKEHGYLKGIYGGGHHHYAHISAIIGCLAIYDESEYARQLLPELYEQMTGGFQSFYRCLGEEDGGFHMWWEYSRYYIFNELEFCDVWRNATGEDLFESNEWLRKTADFLIYGLRDDGTFWGTGDNHARQVKWIDELLLRKIAVEYHDSELWMYADWFAEHRNRFRNRDELFFRVAWEIPEDFPMDEEVFLSKENVKAFSRAGAYIFRDGWNAGNVSALFKCTPTYFFNHSHRDANHFEIWYRDDLAIDSGYYDCYGSSHWFNYYIRTIAHNTVTIFDPDEEITNWEKVQSNDGGQRFSPANQAQPNTLEDLQSGKFKIADSGLLEDNDSYAVAWGDATKAYSSHKCEAFQRFFIWLKKPDEWGHPIIAVIDRVISTKPDYKKTWLLHTINKPAVKDRLVSAINGGGKLWTYVIFPENPVIDIVGGVGREFEVDGRNYPTEGVSRERLLEWAGEWRVELSAREQAKETMFFTVLVPTERMKMAQPKIRRIENGAEIAGYRITFNDISVRIKTPQNEGKSFAFENNE